MWLDPPAARFVGRHDEVERLRALVEDLASGRGHVVLIEGEPGIGKSALLAVGLAEAPPLGCELVWGAADELSERFSLRVMLDCLGVDASSADPSRAEIAATLLGQRPAGLLGAGDPVLAATELLVAMVERSCVGAPLALVIDDLQWADDATLLAWHRLAELVDQMSLLLVGAFRPVPRRDALDRLRRTVQSRDGVVLALQPLPESQVAELVAGLAGAPPGPRLRRLAERAAGNPLYVRELVDALLREKAVVVAAGQADLHGGATEGAPVSLSAAVARRLQFLFPAVTEVLQVAALLGGGFSAAELAVVLGRPEEELMPQVEDAVAAGVLLKAGGRLTFRHALIRQALYEAMPGALRSGLHRHAAKALAEAGASVADVATQIVAAPAAMDHWVLDWLAGAASALANQAPQIAYELLQRAVEELAPGDPRREPLAACLAGLLFRLGRNAEAEAYARAAMAPARDRDRTAHMRWILAYTLMRTGRVAEAAAGLKEALDDAELPGAWRARLLALAATIQAATVGDLDAAEATARQALALGEAEGDRFAIGCALQGLSSVYAVRRDERHRLECVDRALDVLGDDPEYTDLRLILLANRMYSLSVQDRMADAEASLATVRELAERVGDAQLASMHHPAATLYFFEGRWDDALAELDAIPDVPEDRTFVGMVHGLAALIAGRRDDRATAAVHLAAVRDDPLDTPAARLNSLPLFSARTVAAERDRDPAQAVAVLASLLDPQYAQAERHLLLPELVRLAVTVGDVATARKAVETCTADAARDPTASRQAAVQRCQGMLDGDPAPVLEAAAHYRAVGRLPELGQALEDAAVLLARRGEVHAARAAYTEAVERYGELGAAWDLRRADSRIRPYGIRRGARGPRRRGPRFGWEALSPTERLIAGLVARGRSNPDIASELLLSRRTVQSHISHILIKLTAHSRMEIAREAVQHADVE